jgi:hypothetical protein
MNCSLARAEVPAIWKMSTIVPLLKPGKDISDSKSYRPVSLLCPAIKVLERLLLPTLCEHLPVPDYQHGFRPAHSTTSALLDVNCAIAAGFNRRKPPGRTVLLQIDLSKAFDMVNHDKLLTDLNNSTLPGAVVRWLCCYLKGRQSRVLFRDRLSPARNVRTGVPQGAVSSPRLFNFYLLNMPLPPGGVLIVQYADDLSILAVGPQVEPLCALINDYTPELMDFFAERGLAVSPEKSTVTLFTPHSAQANDHPQVFLANTLVPLEKQPKILGQWLDTMYTGAHHCKKQAAKVRQRNNILKGIAGSSWGQDAETLIMTYKAIGRSVAEHAVPVWSPFVSDSSWRPLEVAQNEALRIATGCHKMASIDHIHQESRVLPLRKHADLLTKQYLLACHQEGHPGLKHATTVAPPRHMKGTISDLRGDVLPHLPNNIISKQEYRRGTKAVTAAVAAYTPNRVLGTPPPDIDPAERSLPRSARTALAQLRSGHCRRLNSYLARITPGVADVCPACGASPHSVEHLFDCAANPTQLTTRDLWAKPVEVGRVPRPNQAA